MPSPQLPHDVSSAIGEVARFYYIDLEQTKRWNEHRREGELRLLTGWCWIAKDGKSQRAGFKTITVAYRDAFYTLIEHRDAPIERRRVRALAHCEGRRRTDEGRSMTKPKGEKSTRGPSTPPTPLELARFGHVAATIRAALQAKGWGLPELNQAMGKERGNAGAYKWISGKGAPNPTNAARVAKVLGVAMADLVARDVPEATLAKPLLPVALAPRVEGALPVKRTEVLAFTVDDEGRARIKLDVSLPIDDATPLLRMLLDAGLVMGRAQ